MESGFVLFFLPGRNLEGTALERQLGDFGPWASRRALRPCSRGGTACGTSLVPPESHPKRLEPEHPSGPAAQHEANANVETG